MSKGIGEYQTTQRIQNRMKILNILKDGEWHRYSEIKEKVQLSSPILADHLKELKHFIERKAGEEDYRFTFYKANPTLQSNFFEAELIHASLKDLEADFSKTKDLASALELINAMSNANMILAFSSIKAQIFDVNNPELVKIFLETFVWESYKILTSRLVALWMKFKDEISLFETINKIFKISKADQLRQIEDLIHFIETVKID